MPEARRKDYKLGLSAALWCAFLWGLLPIYWKWLIPIPSSVIILYRVSLSGIVCLIWCLKKYGWQEIKKPLQNKKLVLRYVIAGIIITGNWSIYIAAVNAGYIIQTSVGYFIEPLLVCVFGIVFFKERLTVYKTGAFIFATAAVVVLIMHYGEVPTIALGLAVTFATYAALKKTCKEPALISMLYETIFLVIPALIAMAIVEAKGGGALANGEPYQWALILLAGLFTLVPLVLFAIAAQNLPMITLGITEYISPAMGIFIGIFYGEPFGAVQKIAFLLLGIALTIFTIGEYKEQKAVE